MRLVGFRVQMYRCIVDSGWIDVCALTALVGKNESGKTALLKALHKLNPSVPEPYCMDREWPRRFRKDRNEEQVVCSARFELDPEEIEELRQFSGEDVIPSVFEVRRDYAGRLEVLFPPELFPDRLMQQDLDPLLEMFPRVPDLVGSSFGSKARECLEEAKQMISEGRFSDLARARGEHLQALLNKITSAPTSVQSSDVAGAGGRLESRGESSAAEDEAAAEEAGALQTIFPREREFMDDYRESLKQVLERVTATPSVLEKAREYVSKRIPAFVYISDCQTFTGTAQIDQVKQRKDRGELTEEDRTLLTIMDMAGLDLDEEVDKSDVVDLEQRQFDLDDASVVLTRYLSKHRQRKYQVQLRADGQKFYTFIKDEYDPSLIMLEERSRGFQWFFSFDLMFMHASKGTFKNCVVLLDEPGLHLHPDGQRDLLKRMRDYSADNTIIYTTHMPFMMDLERPDRIRVLSETSNGSIVADDLMESQEEAKLVIRSALSVASCPSYLVAQRNLIVEGIDDYWIMTEMSRLMLQSGEMGLPGDLFVIPSGGAAEAAYIATLLVDHGLDAVVLFDSDDGGEGPKRDLAEKWLRRYPSGRAQVLSLAQCMGMEDGFSIEDIFREEFYLRKVREVYMKQLNAAGCAELALPPGRQLATRVEMALSGYGIKFDKVAVAKALRMSLAKMGSLDELSQETKLAVRRIFATVNAALPQE